METGMTRIFTLSTAAAVRDGVRSFLVGHGGRDEVTWREGVDQFSFYDRRDAVDAAADAVAAHFAS
jgi:hypothetical protein